MDLPIWFVETLAGEDPTIQRPQREPLSRALTDRTPVFSEPMSGPGESQIAEGTTSPVSEGDEPGS